MDDTLNGFRQFKIDNIHNEKETNHTASTLYGYINMPMVNTIYGYQDSELNHMKQTLTLLSQLAQYLPFTLD